jgi:hypothetical protein
VARRPSWAGGRHATTLYCRPVSRVLCSREPACRGLANSIRHPFELFAQMILAMGNQTTRPFALAVGSPVRSRPAWSARFQPLWVLCAASALLLLTGCPSNTRQVPSRAGAASPSVSSVPLRIHVVGELSSPEVIERRWLASSDQPIQIKAQSVEEFLAAADLKADVLLFPSQLLGELIQRDWIIKLPELPSESGVSADDEATRAFSAAALAACQYGGSTYAIPLGCSVPQFIASPALAELFPTGGEGGDPQVTMAQLSEQLAALYGEHESPTAFAEESMDRLALADRFLSLMFQLTDRDARYGVLFDIETMQPRLQAPESKQAAELLRLLARQPDGLVSVLGSHDAAWNWAATHEKPVVAIATTTRLGPEALESTAGRLLQVENAKPINVGRGLIVAVSANCRQTFHSLNFIKWLSLTSTAQVLAPLVRGVDPIQPLSIDATAWRARQSISQSLNVDTVPQEPRFHRAHAVRLTLADALVEVIVKEKEIDRAFGEAMLRLSETTSQAAGRFERDYKTSLGLRGSSR